MAVIKVNATETGLQPHLMHPPIAPSLAQLAEGPGPVVVMLHGYRYAPGDPTHCPHRTILSQADPCSWPVGLGLADTGTSQGRGQGRGQGIALGWAARCSLRRAHARARDHGRDLALLVSRLRAVAPDRPVHVVAHSLGSEVALSALPHLRRGALDRLILLTGATHCRHAEEMLETPAGRSVEVLNVTSRENDLFDAAFERLVPSSAPQDRAIGQGIDAPNALTLQLDCPATLAALADLGLEIGAPRGRVSHWSAYTRPGVMALYSRMLHAPETLPLALLQSVLPRDTARRWSRLWPAIGIPVSPPRLPGGFRAATRTRAQAQPSPSCSTA